MTTTKRHLKLNGTWYEECRGTLEMWQGKTPFDKYYKNCNKEFWFYACHTPVPGYFYEDEKVIFYQDFRTPERYKEYRDCGLNVLYLQPNDGYYGEDFETSQLKKNLDAAKAGGIDKVIVCDMRIHALSEKREPLIGEDKQFKTYQELVNYVKECIKPYKDYENGLVIGLMLVDEPIRCQLPQAALMFKVVREVWPEAYIDECLLPLDASFKGMNGVKDEFLSFEDAYADYIDDFLSWSEGKYFSIDSYPLRGNATKDGGYLEYILPSHFYGLQLLNRICKAHGARFYGMSNSCELAPSLDRKDPSLRAPTEDEMYWQNNSYLLFGVKCLQYYTYWAKTSGNNKGEYHIDGTCFINRDGTRTEMYYYMKRMHEELQKFAKVMLNFEYKKVNYYIKERMYFSTNYLHFDETAEDFGNFTAMEVCEQRHSCAAVITELQDEKNNQLMYAVMNPQHPALSRFIDNNADITLKFADKYKFAEVWHNGVRTTVELNRGKIRIEIDAGHAVYLLPF